MKLTELFQEIGEPFSYYPGFTRRFGISTNASVLLCFIGWKTFSDEIGGWKGFTSEAIERATGLSVKEQATAREQLLKAGLIEEHYARLEHTLKFRLTKAEIGVSPSAQSANAHPPNRQMPIRPIGSSFKGQERETKEGGAPHSLLLESGGEEQSERHVAREGEVAPTRRFSNSWCSEFQKKFGEKYPYQQKDGVQAARLLKNVTPEEAIETAKKAWNQTDDKKFWNCVHMSKDVAQFASRYVKIRIELKQVKKTEFKYT